MNRPTLSKSDKHSKRKMALVPLLVLLLLYVLFRPKESSPVVPHSATASQRNRPVRKTKSTVKITRTQSQHQYVLPQLSIIEITQHDPFRLLPLLKKEEPSKSVESEVIASEQQEQINLEILEEEAQKDKLAEIKEMLQSQVISGILYSQTRKSAIIDSKVYHEGDMLNDDVRLIKINRDGVVVRIESFGELIRR